ncbi:MAG: TIM-barrel domain-containing protein [Spirochaetaceae bacterium]
MFQSVEYDDMRENLLGKPNVEFSIPGRVVKVYEDEYGCTLLCEGWRYKKEKMPPLFIQDDLALVPTGETESLAVRIEAFAPAVVRVRMGRISYEEGSSAAGGGGNHLEARVTEMQVNREAERGLLSSRRENEAGDAQADGRYIVLSTGTVEARVDTEDWRLTMGPAGSAAPKGDNGPVFRQYTRDEHAISHLIGQQDPGHAEAYDGFESFPFALGYDPDTDSEFWTDAIELEHDEHLYGFGEKFGPLDKLGQEVLLWHTDSLSVSTAKSYKNIPFFMSTAGYGVYLNSSAKCRFLAGSYHYKAYQMICHEGEVDYFFIYGPSMKEVLPRYTDITGKTPMLPQWSFGCWMSKNTYRTQEELLSVARIMREKKIPCDVMHLDVGWFEHDWMCDYEFSAERFPDPKAMTEELEEMGYRLSVWQLPYFKRENKLYPEAQKRGLFARRPDGGVSTPEADGVLDLSNREAVKWYQGKLKQLLDRGVSIIKVDFGESTEEEALYEGGTRPEEDAGKGSPYHGGEMHNLYPLLYNRAAFDVTKLETGEGIIWARSAWAGSQRYPLHWGGDSGSDFHGMYHSLRGGLSFGLSGFPFWSHDVGGYYGDTDTDVYVRWAQMGMFSSHMRMHGTSSREPWRFGKEAEDIFLLYARLRYRLLPYIWRQAEECARHSLPMLRAMLLEFPEDPTTWSLDDQYLFGDSLLVAPVLSRRSSRRVYLPAGETWYDFWTDERFTGGQWVEKKTPLDTMPLYVRGGSIIEAGPELNYVGEKKIERLDLHYYPGVPLQDNIPVKIERSFRIYGGGRAAIEELPDPLGNPKLHIGLDSSPFTAELLLHGMGRDDAEASGFEDVAEAGPGIRLPNGKWS